MTVYIPRKVGVAMIQRFMIQRVINRLMTIYIPRTVGVADEDKPYLD